MNYQLKIDLTHLLGQKYTNYGVILTENHPQIKYLKGHNGPQIVSYLWYPIELGQIHNSYDVYLREKLAVTNPAEAQRIISNWNSRYVPTSRIVKQFKIGRKRFTVIDEPNNSGMLIVLANYADRPSYTETGHAGSVGYIWQRLSINNPTIHAELKSKFCLRSISECERFLKKW